MSDIIIVGGGINGLLTAREFSVSGATVTLIERNALGQEASWAGGGILLPIYPWRQEPAITPLCTYSLARYSQLAETLHADTGIDPEWLPSGMLILDNPDIDRAVAWCGSNAVPYQQPDKAAIAALAPGLQFQCDNPLWLPSIAHIRNPRLLQALHADLKRRGVRILEDHTVTELKQHQRRIIRITTRLGELHGDHFVLATGAWSGQLWSGLFPHLRITPVKGQMIVFKAEPALLRPMVLSEGRYLIPRRDGRILAGSTLEYSGFDKSTTAQARAELEHFAASLCPDLRRYGVEKHWAGLRPGTPSGIPYITRHPAIDNLGLNCGHFRNGLLMAPASAALMLALMLDRPPPLPAEPYSFDAPH